MNMPVLFHVVIASLGIALSTSVALRPSRVRLRLSYISIALTLASGSYLVIITHSPLLGSCISGLAYLAVTSVGVYIGRRRLPVPE